MFFHVFVLFVQSAPQMRCGEPCLDDGCGLAIGYLRMHPLCFTWFKVLQIKRVLCALCHCLSSVLSQVALECGAAGVILQCESADGSGAAASRFLCCGGCIN